MELHNIRSEAKGLTTWGCMWKQGECPTDTQQSARKYFICQNDKGEKVSIQSRITAYWQDGSVKWSAQKGLEATLQWSCQIPNQIWRCRILLK